MLMLCHCVM